MYWDPCEGPTVWIVDTLLGQGCRVQGWPRQSGLGPGLRGALVRDQGSFGLPASLQRGRTGQGVWPSLVEFQVRGLYPKAEPHMYILRADSSLRRMGIH